MRNFLVIFSVFAMLLSITSDIAHAHNFLSGESNTTISAIDFSDTQNNETEKNCDMACSNCCAHSHSLSTDNKYLNSRMLLSNKVIPEVENLDTSDFIYGLKRPPKA